MTKYFLLILILFSPKLRCQIIPDSIIAKYNAAVASPQKGEILYHFHRDQMPGSDFEKAHILLNTKSYFEKNKDNIGKNYMSLLIGSISWKLGEYNSSLNYSFPSLKYFETTKDTFGIILSLKEIGNSFVNSQNYPEGLNYCLKALPKAKQFQNAELITALLNNTADCYNRMSRPDSALTYIQDAIRIAEINKDFYGLSIYYSTLGETYLLRGEHEIGRLFLKKSITYSKPNDRYGIAFTYNTLSQSFFSTQAYDSALNYSRQALYLAEPDLKSILATTYSLLYKTYQNIGNKDSVLKYVFNSLIVKDSLFAIEKSRNIQILSFKEEIRQQELVAEDEKSKERRKLNIEYGLISLCLISFIIIFLVVSRSISINAKWITFLGVIALLLVFEFVNLLIHPFLESMTRHSPILMLLALVIIASILVPLHHKVEKWSINSLVEKNKKIRLAAAKKVIDALERK